MDRWVEVGSDSKRAMDALRAVVIRLNGTIVSEDDQFITVHFGSLSKSRLFGEFWVSGRTLSSCAQLEVCEEDSTGVFLIRILVVDRHRWGLKWGYVNKYQQSLQDTANALVEGIIHADPRANEVRLGASGTRVRSDIATIA